MWQAQRWADLGRQPPTPSQHQGPSWNPLEFDALRRRELWTYSGSPSRECLPSLKDCCRGVLPSGASRVQAEKSIRLSIRRDARAFNITKLFRDLPCLLVAVWEMAGQKTNVAFSTVLNELRKKKIHNMSLDGNRVKSSYCHRKYPFSFYSFYLCPKGRLSSAVEMSAAGVSSLSHLEESWTKHLFLKAPDCCQAAAAAAALVSETASTGRVNSELKMTGRTMTMTKKTMTK